MISRAAAPPLTMTSSRHLAEVVSAKEKELAEIRIAAADAAETEGRQSQERFLQLRHDFEFNLKLLAERDGVIESLSTRVAEMERDRTSIVAEAEQKIATEANATVRRLKNEMEEEYEQKLRIGEDAFRRNLCVEFEQKERQMREEITSNSSVELERQRQDIVATYKQMMSEKEIMCLQRMEEMRKQLQQRDEAFAALEEKSRKKEDALRQQFEEARSSIWEQMKEEADSFLRKTIQEGRSQAEEKCRGRDEQIALMLEDHARLKHQMDAQSAEKDGKISDLLNTLRDVEQAFALRVKEHEEHCGQIMNKLEVQSNENVKLQRDIERQTSSSESVINNLQREHREKESAWAERENLLVRKIARLGEQLKKLKITSDEREERAAGDITDARLLSTELEQQNELLKSERDRYRSKVESLSRLVEVEKECVSRLNADRKEEKVRHEETLKATVEQQKKSLDTELMALRKEYESDKQLIIKERDEALMERKSTLSMVEELQTQCIELKNMLSKGRREMNMIPSAKRIRGVRGCCDHGDSLCAYSSDSDVPNGFVSSSSVSSGDFDERCGSPNRHQSKLETAQDSLRDENTRLKRMIAMMRNEMESLTKAKKHGELNRADEMRATSSDATVAASAGDTINILEQQLRMCHEYLDLLLDCGGGSYQMHSAQHLEEITMLRKNFRDLHSVVNELRNKNSRLYSEKSCLAKSVKSLQQDKSSLPPPSTGRIVSSHEQELEKRLEETQQELDVLQSDRNSLIDLSNKLRSDLRRAQDDTNHHCDSVPSGVYHGGASLYGSSTRERHFCSDKDGGDDINHVTSPDGSSDNHLEDIGVARGKTNQQEEDVVESLHSSSILLNGGKVEYSIAPRATDRTTASQRESLQKLRRGQQKQREDEAKKTERKMQVRNYNVKDG